MYDTTDGKYKPITLFSFYSKNDHGLKLSKENSRLTSYKNSENNVPEYINNLKTAQSKNNENKKYVNNQNQKSKRNKLNYEYNFNYGNYPKKKAGTAYSTSTNFYKGTASSTKMSQNRNNNNLTRKYVIIDKSNSNNNNDFYGNIDPDNLYMVNNNYFNNQRKNVVKRGNVEFINCIQSMRNSPINEYNLINNKVLEKYLNGNIESFMNFQVTNNNEMKKSKTSKNPFKISNTFSKYPKNNNNMTKSSTKSTNNIRRGNIKSPNMKNIIKTNFNNNDIYNENYLPYLDSSKDNYPNNNNNKLLPKSQKHLLIDGSINNYINPNYTNNGFYSPSSEHNNILNNNYRTKYNLTKNSNNSINKNTNANTIVYKINNNTNNPVINTTTSNTSNVGNNNIIFNMRNSSKNTNNFFSSNEIGNLNSNNNQIKVGTFYSFHKKQEITNGKSTEENITTNNNNNTKNKDQQTINDLIFKEEIAKVKIDIQNELIKSNKKNRAISTAPKETKSTKNENNNNIDVNLLIKTKTNNIKIIDENENNENKDKLAKYEIGELLGKGAYAEVKLVTNKFTKEKFAMKIYDKSKINSNSKKRCVYKEIEILKKLNHKNIAKLYEVIKTDKQILLVQELIEGISLRDYYNKEIRNQKGISIHKENVFKNIFKQIFDAMNYLHKKNIAHRDIKLENILMKKNYEIKIIDFGFSMYNPENKLQSFFCGTPNYMPPEIAEKKPYIGQYADLWSLGVLVFKFYCADFPFKGKNEKELYVGIKSGKFNMASYTPEYIQKIICGLLVLDPYKRMSCQNVLNSDWLKEN